MSSTLTFCSASNDLVADYWRMHDKFVASHPNCDEDSSAGNEYYSEWLVENFPLPQFELEWDSRDAIEYFGEWHIGNASYGNVWVLEFSPADLYTISGVLVKGCQSEGFDRLSDKDQVPKLVQYLLGQAIKQNRVLMLHEDYFAYGG